MQGVGVSPGHLLPAEVASPFPRQRLVGASDLGGWLGLRTGGKEEAQGSWGACLRADWEETWVGVEGGDLGK